jgi:hypothetical protein
MQPVALVTVVVMHPRVVAFAASMNVGVVSKGLTLLGVPVTITRVVTVIAKNVAMVVDIAVTIVPIRKFMTALFMTTLLQVMILSHFLENVVMDIERVQNVRDVLLDTSVLAAKRALVLSIVPKMVFPP